ncbi:MAG: hypothetical protein WCV79_02875 [Candidatus Paceibacterota bacterium]
MEKEDLKKLEGELKKATDHFSEQARIRLGLTKSVIDKKIKDVIETYSNNIKNLGLISGTVAPFSLTLLTIQELNVNSIILLIGFFILLINIILSQQFLSEQTQDFDTRITKSQIKHMFAESKLQEINDPNKSPSDKFGLTVDYLKEMNEAEELLGIGEYDINALTSKNNMRKYNKIINTAFVGGSCLIMLSTVFNKIAVLISSCL